MAFQFASTNLVIELGIVMWLLLGWQFVLGEFVGGPLMIVLMALLSARSCVVASSTKRTRSSKIGRCHKLPGGSPGRRRLPGL
jgi:hypothetical protein